MKRKVISFNIRCSNDPDGHSVTATDMPIDYYFVDEHVMPASRKLIMDTIGGKVPSDHYGIFMELEL